MLAKVGIFPQLLHQLRRHLFLVVHQGAIEARSRVDQILEVACVYGGLANRKWRAVHWPIIGFKDREKNKYKERESGDTAQ